MRPISRYLLLPFTAALLPFGALHACTRHADVRDDLGQTASFDPTPHFDADIPPLDVDLSNDRFATCAERPQGDCVGSNDFLCGFAPWAIAVAKQCQLDTGCKTNGSVEITMGPEGCVTAIGMDEPNDEIVACLVAALSAVQCPCLEEESISHYFGIGNTGICPE
jgi:hypothetical protein